MGITFPSPPIMLRQLRGELYQNRRVREWNGCVPKDLLNLGFNFTGVPGVNYRRPPRAPLLLLCSERPLGLSQDAETVGRCEALADGEYSRVSTCFALWGE